MDLDRLIEAVKDAGFFYLVMGLYSYGFDRLLRKDFGRKLPGYIFKWPAYQVDDWVDLYRIYKRRKKDNGPR